MDQPLGKQFERISLLLGENALSRLAQAKVAVFGLGGVGSFACEALARSGIGNFLLIDFDTIQENNINRQIMASYDTIGHTKAQAMEKRIKAINPSASVTSCAEFLDLHSIVKIIAAEEGQAQKIHFCLEAIDSLSPKTAVILQLVASGIPFVSSMGAGGRLNPLLVKAGNLSLATECGLAERLRKRLKKAGLDPRHIPVVYSLEKGVKPQPREKWDNHDLARGRVRPKHGSVCFVPAAFGLCMAHLAFIHLLQR